MTFLSFDCLTSNKIACINAAFALLFEEIVEPQIQKLFKDASSACQNKGMRIERMVSVDYVSNVWENESPLLESIENMKSRVQYAMQSRLKAQMNGVGLFEKAKKLGDGKVRNRFSQLEAIWDTGTG